MRTARSLLLMLMLAFLMLTLRSAPTQGATPNSPANLPAPLAKCLGVKRANSSYKVFQMASPAILRFNGLGNGQLLCAMLLEEVKSGEVVLLVLSESTCQTWVIRNVGPASFRGVKGFGWCVSWQVLSKPELANLLSYDAPKEQAIGEGLLLSPGETEGRYIYWSGNEWKLAEGVGP